MQAVETLRSGRLHVRRAKSGDEDEIRSSDKNGHCAPALR
jgi:hypothetical protein